MGTRLRSSVALALVGCVWSATARGIGAVPAPAGQPSITTDVVYGHKDGLALTLDVHRPAQPNGAGVISIVSGGWQSSVELARIFTQAYPPFIEKGFTVFAVRHGSWPRCAVLVHQPQQHPYHILIALADGDRHGYAVMQAIREQSGGEVRVQTASFYRHLAMLIDEGLVAESASRRDGDDPRRGTYYRITPRGRQVLAAEKQRLLDLVSQMKKIRLSPRKADA